MIFVDTAAFLAIENRRDAHHEEALRYWRSCLEKGKPLVTSDYVLDESYTIMRVRAGHTVAVQFGEALRASRLLRVEHITPETIEAGWRIFKDFSDHAFGFTDCTSFALMQRLGIEAAFTFDAHFGQYGRFLINPKI
jgi:predicted nucleic acid-binding protein